MSLIDICKKIYDYDNFIIIPHINPDGDAVGSAMSLCTILRKIGKTAYIADISDNMPNNVGFLDITDFIAPDSYNYKTAFSVDCADKMRLFDSELFDACDVSFSIDHHVTNNEFASYSYVDANSSATGEIVYEILKNLNVKLDKQLAKYLYTSIASDTGNFKFSNTTSKTFKMAADLYDVYGEFSDLSRIMFDEVSLNQLKANEYVLSNLKLIMNGKIALTFVHYDYLEQNGLTFNDVEFLSSLPRRIKGVEVGVFVKIKKDEIKVSLRSNKYIDVSKIASLFGGGGHIRASGVSFYDTPFDLVCEKLIKAIENEIKKRYE